MINCVIPSPSGPSHTFPSSSAIYSLILPTLFADNFNRKIMTPLHEFSPAPADTSVERLFHAVGDAEDLIGTLVDPRSLTSPEAVALKLYVSVIRALITVTPPTTERTEWTNNMNLTQSLVGLPMNEWKFRSQLNSNQQVDDLEKNIQTVLIYSAEAMCNLIQKELAPMRLAFISLIDLIYISSFLIW